MINPEVSMINKTTVPVGYTESLCNKYPGGKFLFSPDFCEKDMPFLEKKLNYIYDFIHVFDENGNEMNIRPNIHQLVLGNTNEAFSVG